MREIALHILDIVENSINAAASHICILIDETYDNRYFLLEIVDNGKGVPEEMIDRVTDPFVTTRTTRKVGLGISMLKVAAERCNGYLDITSTPGKGTTLCAVFERDHIDRAPLGDMEATLTTLIFGYTDIDFTYHHIMPGNEFVLDTKELKARLDGVDLSHPAVIETIREIIQNNINGSR